MKGIYKTIKIIMSVMQYTLILISLAVVIMLIAPRAIGIRPFVVLSGSMEKEIKTGAVAYSDSKAKVEDVKVGDIIVFKLNETYVTHRVIKINEDSTFTTKGDANQTEDLAPVKFEDFKGKTIFSIPYLGYLLQVIQTRLGKFILFTIIGINIIYFIFASDEKKKEERRANVTNNESKEIENQKSKISK